jgi:hypothetical protein
MRLKAGEKLEYELGLVLQLPAARQEGLGISCRRPATNIPTELSSLAAELPVLSL